MANISIIAKSIGLIIAIAYLVIGPNYPVLDYALFGLILMLVGIPHGAIDHLTSNPNTSKSTLGPFLIKYVLMILIYSVVWYFLPMLALILFLGMSAYHFGQTHFIKRIEVSSAKTALLYLSRGAFYLAIIILGSFEDSQSILASIIDITPLYQLQWYILFSLFFLSLIMQRICRVKFSSGDLLELTALPVLLYFTPLAVSFILYFGIWHSIPSMVAEYHYLRQFPCCQNLGDFLKQLLPFTFLSFVGISLILWAGLTYLSSEELVLLFFVLISLISFPHILYMDNFIKKKINTDRY